MLHRGNHNSLSQKFLTAAYSKGLDSSKSWNNYKSQKLEGISIH